MTLRRRLMLAFAAYTVLVAVLFALLAAAFVYAVEDRFFETALAQEAASLQRQHGASGVWPRPRGDGMTLYLDASALPAELRQILQEEPGRREFSGAQGRHYHLRGIETAAGGAPVWLVAEVSQQLVVRPMREAMLRLLLGAGALLVGLALLIAWLLARRTTAPLARLAALVGSMEPARLPQAIASDFADDEVGVVARGLDRLIARTRDFIAREQSFTGDASHELRTPLAVIRAAGEQLRAEPGLSDAARRQLDHVRQSAWQLEQTVTTLLALAREQRAEAASEPVALLPLVERVVLEQGPLLESKSVQVEVELPRSARMHLPQPVLHMLLANLIGNAFAHGNGGRVRIDLQDGRVCIRNRGPAITPALQERLFEPFVKGEASAGFGLGLAIVQRLCEQHHIDLQIGSREDGETVASFALA